MREKNIEAYLRKEVERIGGKAYKFSSPGSNGVPDRIILLPGGRVRFVELKAEGKELRPIQLFRKRQFEKLGFTVYVVDSVDKVNSFIEEVMG